MSSSFHFFNSVLKVNLDWQVSLSFLNPFVPEDNFCGQVVHVFVCYVFLSHNCRCQNTEGNSSHSVYTVFFFLQWWLGAYCITLHMSMSVKKAIQKALKNQSTSDKTALCGDLKGCCVCSSTQAVLIFSCVNFQGPKGNRGEQGPMGLPVSLWTSICFIYNRLYISPAEWCTFVMLHCDIWPECLTYDNIINLLVIHNIALNDLCF